jgi:para-aminobenzoate synthetase component 1
MNLFSDDFPYWFYLPEGCQKWNFRSGLYLLEKVEKPTFHQTLIFIPYHFHSRQELFSLEYVQFFKIKKHSEKFSFEASDSLPKLKISSAIRYEDYIRKADSLKKEIHRGNIYEINFCLEFFSEPVEINPGNVFEYLYKKILAPYSILVRMQEMVYLCFSPELFLERQGERLITCPIKGTYPKNQKNQFLYNEAARVLRGSVKETSENAMAVDVARNDFSKIARRNSVHVPELFKVEELENIFQMYSTVTCELKENTGWEEIWKATFPMASMTGAPKVSAMERIEQYENFHRGFYSGSIGLFQNPENAVMNVIIRSPEYSLREKKFRICAGSAITWLADPINEWEECKTKIGSIFPHWEIV